MDLSSYCEPFGCYELKGLWYPLVGDFIFIPEVCYLKYIYIYFILMQNISNWKLEWLLIPICNNGWVMNALAKICNEISQSEQLSESQLLCLKNWEKNIIWLQVPYIKLNVLAGYEAILLVSYMSYKKGLCLVRHFNKNSRGQTRVHYQIHR